MEYVSTDMPEKVAGERLTKYIRTHSDVPALLLFSGGSAFKLLRYVDVNALDERVTIGILDERCSDDPEVNNYLQLKSTAFFRDATGCGAHAISTEVGQVSCDEAARRWEKDLQKWFMENQNGVCVATMGVGIDGHTAGIMPGVSGIDFSGASWVVSYQVSPEVNSYTKRITTTFTFLREKVDYALMYVEGENKREILASLKEKAKLNEKPFHIIKEMHMSDIVTNIA